PDPGTEITLAVGDSRLIARHMLPGLTAVVGSRQTRAALQRSTNHINSLAGRMHGDRNAYASVVLRQRCDFDPRLTFIDRFVECGAVWSLWRTTPAAESAKAAAGTL